MKLSRLCAFLAFLLLCASGTDARAFTHIVQPGETLAAIAERFYGRIQYEKLLVAANNLDAQGGSPIVPGMRLEVPALGHYRVRPGDSWNGLAQKLLGAKGRADVLAAANGTSPWLPPSDGAEIVVPYNLKVVATGTDTTITIAYRYLGNMNKAWVLDHYNGFKGRHLRRGDLVLVPLTDLPLTPDGKKAAAQAAGAACSEAAGSARLSQKRVQNELPALMADVQNGRYVEAVTRGNRFLSSGPLSQPQLATVERELLEAYVALDATGLATAACNAWRKHDTKARLDPALLSPKIIAACKRGHP